MTVVPTALQRRRGTTAEHEVFTGLAGEFTYDTERKQIVAHDGATAGGFPVQRADAGPITAATTARTLSYGDIGKLIRFTSGSAITVTLPQDSTENLVVGFQCVIFQDGAGQITFAKEGSDVIHSRGALVKTAGQYAAVTVVKLESGVWALIGDLGA